MKCKREGCNNEAAILRRTARIDRLPYCEEHWFKTYDKEQWK
jgi:hypothetical protein